MVVVSVVVAASVDSSKNGTFYFLGQVITITLFKQIKTLYSFLRK